MSSPLVRLRALRRALLRRTQHGGGLLGRGVVKELRAAGAAPRVLALHGFGATPSEVALVGAVAQSLGLGVLAPLLPGHGSDARDLAGLGFDDWYAAARAGLDDLTRDGTRAIVAGVSLGSLLALRLAAREPERVCAALPMSNALWLRAPHPRLTLRLAEGLGLQQLWVPKDGPDIVDPVARRAHLTYGAQPVHAALEVLHGGAAVQRELGAVTCPTLVVHGGQDRVCPVSNAARLATLLGTRDVEVLVLPRSGHIVTCDLERERLRAALRVFFAKVRDDERRRRAAGSG